MSTKEEALNISADAIFNNGQVHRVVFCDGTWSETTATKQEILSTSVIVARPIISYISSTFEATTNSLTVLLQNISYVPPSTFSFNRVAILSDGKEEGTFEILSIAGNDVTLNGTPTDWSIGETVYTTSGTYLITNIVGSVITLDGTPTGTTLTNGTGVLSTAIELDSKTFTSGTTTLLEVDTVLSGN